MTKCTEAAAREAALVRALDKIGCLYNRVYPCITAMKDYPAEWCIRCRALADTSPAAAALLAQGEALRGLCQPSGHFGGCQADGFANCDPKCTAARAAMPGTEN